MEISRPAPRQIHITSPYGPRKAPTPGASTFHHGIDYGGKFQVSVARKGKVVAKGYDAHGYGHYVLIRHAELTPRGLRFWQTMYGHGSHASNLSVGKRVAEGAHVFISGKTGIATGDHLHFELRKRIGKTYVPVNPAPYIV